MMQLRTKNYYHQKVADVLFYINNNIGGDLSVKTLSEIFGISFFHFHRILRASIDEPLGNYIDKIRLETALKLIRYSKDNLSEIAISIGFNDISSFSKAFSKEFGISPRDFKDDKNIILNTHVDYKVEKNKLVHNIKPKMIITNDKNIYFIRLKAKYGSELVAKAWDELADFATKNKLFGWKPDIFSIYYDDPDVVGIDSCISEVCIASAKEVLLSGRVGAKQLKGGKYAVFRYKGPYDYLWDLYILIYKDWLMNTDIKLRDFPTIEKYLNFSPKTDPNRLLTEIYLPIE
jgi:AraC family transcriptional regulator